jgi:hypothetical protein
MEECSTAQYSMMAIDQSTVICIKEPRMAKEKQYMRQSPPPATNNVLSCNVFNLAVATKRKANIPVSSRTNRVLHGQVHLNKQFPKSYISELAPRESPVPNLTLGRAWHVASACSRLKLYVVIQCVVLNLLLPITTYLFR